MINFRARLAVWFVLVLLAAAGPSRAYEVQWPQPKVPEGTNPATFPLPRLDWLAHFLFNRDRSQAKQYDFILEGDSITDLWQGPGKDVWAQHYGYVNSLDVAISGDQVQHVLWRLENGQVDGQNPKLVMMMIGTNNMGSALTPDQIAEGIQKLLTEYKQKLPNAHFLLLGIFPRANLATDPARAKIAATNKIISGFGDKAVTYLDIGDKFLQPDGTLTREIMPDFLHPSAKGYEIWANAIQPVMDQYFPKQ
jgi:beta-glucosidase